MLEADRLVIYAASEDEMNRIAASEEDYRWTMWAPSTKLPP